MFDVTGMSLVIQCPGNAYGKPDLASHFVGNSGPRLEESPPPLKSARSVKPTAGEKRNCSDIECDMGKVLYLYYVCVS